MPIWNFCTVLFSGSGGTITPCVGVGGEQGVFVMGGSGGTITPCVGGDGWRVEEQGGGVRGGAGGGQGVCEMGGRGG